MRVNLRGVNRSVVKLASGEVKTYRLHEFAFVQFHLRAANHQFLHEKRIAKPENGADVVVLRHAVEHDRDRPPRPSKKFVTGKFGVAQLRRGQRPAHILPARQH